jgi:predicted nuclease of restriction endonuclease-like (RecB) superfamily
MNDFKLLIKNISVVHNHLQQQATNAINQALTVRNWLIGYYIVEYEQNGNDKAIYGENLLKNIALECENIKGADLRSLYRFRQFYLIYSQIARCIVNNPILGSMTPLSSSSSIMGSLTPLLENLENSGYMSDIQELEIRGSLTPELKNLKKSSLKLPNINSEFEHRVKGEIILSKLSYTHIEQLIRINDDLKRTFYEIECIKGTWNVRELKRQIASLYYERSGLSAKPEKLSKLVQQKTIPQLSTDIIKNIYSFEFLDISTNSIVEESDLETALLNNLQEFIIELGNGFCLEARQKRILIGDNYYFIDLVFYHRILKCHVLVDLKMGAFEHGDIGQLNTYLNYYKAEVTETSDNPPVGILLVAEKDHALVKYATAGMDENLFVQQYLIKLPSKQQLEKYIDNELKKFI